MIPGKPGPSTPKRNIHASKIMLCIWWDQRGVIYYELLKPSETITGDRYRLQLIRLNQALKEKRTKWDNRHDKLILLHDNARPHVAKDQAMLGKGVENSAPSAVYSPKSLFGKRFNYYKSIKKMTWWIDRFKRTRFFSFEISVYYLKGGRKFDGAYIGWTHFV